MNQFIPTQPRNASSQEFAVHTDTSPAHQKLFCLTCGDKGECLFQ